jgi:hypothetical protein
MTPYSTALAVYLTVFLAVAVVATVAALGTAAGTAAGAVARSRRVRLTRHESLRTFYAPRLALHR